MLNDNSLTSSNQISIMLVEDYPLLRHALTAILDSQPEFNTLASASDGETAIKLLSNKQPDILILDIGLPGIDGIHVASHVKTFWPEVKIIILTSSAYEDEVLAALATGASAYCLKNIQDSQLIMVIKAVSEGAVWIDPHIAHYALRVFQNSSLREPLTTSSQGNDFRLTERELETLHFLVEGKTNPEIAELMSISIHTVKAHIAKIIEKLAVSDRVQAAVKAIKENLVVR